MVINLIADGPLPADFALKVFLCYSAAILSFLGGIRWGAATNLQTAMGRELTISIMPSLWAVLFLLMTSAQWSVWGLLSGFVLIGIVDCRWPVPDEQCDGRNAASETDEEGWPWPNRVNI